MLQDVQAQPIETSPVVQFMLAQLQGEPIPLAECPISVVHVPFGDMSDESLD